MPRTSQLRAIRSTQSAPNTGTIRDLTNTYGTAANSTTIAAYATGGTVSTIRFNPNATASAAATIPNTGTAPAGQGWRDVVAEHASESVRYDAGTWTLRARFNKSGQAVVTDIVVRITMIVYKVSSGGSFLAEIGRVTLPDTTIGAAAVNASASFTGVATTFAAGDRIQIEAYVEHVVSGVAVAPTSAVNVIFVVDATSATASAITAMPGYQILYARALSVTGTGTAVATRRIVGARSFSTSGAGSAVAARSLALARPRSTSGGGTAAMTKRLAAVRAMTVAGAGTAAYARSMALRRDRSTSGAGVASIVKAAVMARARSTTGTGTASALRQLALQRSASAAGSGLANAARSFVFSRLHSTAGTGTATATRLAVRARSHSTTGSGTATFARSLSKAVAASTTGAGSAVLAKAMLFARSAAAAGSGVARMRIEMPESVLDRMIAGGGTIINVIRRALYVFDD